MYIFVKLYKAPQAPEPWPEVKDATIEQDGCFARHTFTKELIGSEDCLYLNVYTKNVRFNAKIQ